MPGSGASTTRVRLDAATSCVHGPSGASMLKFSSIAYDPAPGASGQLRMA